MANYQFLTTWLLDAPIEKVWDAISDYGNLPAWWKAVAQTSKIESGNATGAGSIWLITWKTPLSYRITFEFNIIKVEAPKLLELTAKGDVEGKGRWELESVPEGTLVRYYWTVKTTKAWMNVLALFVRPLLEWNHNAIMRAGGKDLAQFLGATVLKVETF